MRARVRVRARARVRARVRPGKKTSLLKRAC